MKPSQRLLLISAGAGAGAILATVLVLLTMVWYSARTKDPAPWNANAMQAKYDKVGTGSTLNGQGDKTQEIRFYYVVTNQTDSDYKVGQADSISLMGKLEDERSLLNEEAITIDRPFFIPPKQSVRLTIHVANYGLKEVEPDRNSSEHEQYINRLIEYINHDMGNLDGFVLYDNSTRYQINFPSGWKRKR